MLGLTLPKHRPYPSSCYFYWKARLQFSLFNTIESNFNQSVGFMMIAIYYQAKKLFLLTQTHGCKDALPLTRDRPQKKKFFGYMENFRRKSKVRHEKQMVSYNLNYLCKENTYQATEVYLIS